jgi:membrane protein implicated in regulation of membrane protease activity
MLVPLVVMLLAAVFAAGVLALLAFVTVVLVVITTLLFAVLLVMFDVRSRKPRSGVRAATAEHRVAEHESESADTTADQ